MWQKENPLTVSLLVKGRDFELFLHYNGIIVAEIKFNKGNNCKKEKKMPFWWR